MPKKRVHEIAKEQGLSSKELLDKLHAAGVEAKVASSSVEESQALEALGRNGAGNSATAVLPESKKAAARGGTPPRAAPAIRARARATAAPRRLRPKTRVLERAASGAGCEAQAHARHRRRSRHRAATGVNCALVAAGLRGRATEPAKAEIPAAGPSRHPARPTRDSRTGERAPGGVGPGGRRRVVIDSQASRRQQGGPAQAPPQRTRRRGRRRRATYEETVAPLQSPEVSVAERPVGINSGSTVKDVAEYLRRPRARDHQAPDGARGDGDPTQTLSDEAIALLAEELGKQVEIVHAADDPSAEPEFEDAEADLPRSGRPSSRSWATSITARPRCSTPSARPRSPPPRPAASRSTSVPTR